MKKLSPVMQTLTDDAPEDWQATPPGYLVVLRRLEEQGRVEIRPKEGSSRGFEWRRLHQAPRRKAS